MVVLELPKSAFSTLGLISTAAVITLSPIYIFNIVCSWYHRRRALSQQSRVLPGPERIHESVLEFDDDFLELHDDPTTTCYELFLHGMKISNNGPCLGFRNSQDDEYEWLKYDEVLHRAHRLASATIQLGIKPGNETLVGIYLPNRPEWVVCMLGFSSLSITLVPLYENLNTESLKHIIIQAGLSVIVCDKAEKVKKILRILPLPSTLKLMFLIDFSNLDEETKNIAAENGIGVKDFDEMLESGHEGLVDQALLPKPNDVFVVCYTSGTTGVPKGVMLTHGNVVLCIKAVYMALKTQGVYPSHTDSRISYLPAGHSYELMSFQLGFLLGCRVGFYCGDIRGLQKDIKDLAPTILPVVPRVLNRIYENVNLSLQNKPWQRLLFNFAVHLKQAQMSLGITRNNIITDNLIFSKIHNEFGGNLKIMTVGSAPMASEVLSVCRAMLGCQIIEGYGQTETSGPVSITLASDTETGHVGGLLPGVQVKLIDVPELEYFAKDDKGEILVRSKMTMLGYLRDPEKTRETLDEGGWIHTGDIGMWQNNGSLKIIDRKKHIFKLSQGEYIAPERVENVYCHNPLVMQIFIDGSSIQTYLVAIVVPEKSELFKWAASQNIEVIDLSSLCSEPKAIEYVLQEMKKTGQRLGLNSLEQVKKIHLCPEPFTVGNGCLTPTLKNRRPALRKKFAQIVENLYQS